MNKKTVCLIVATQAYKEKDASVRVLTTSGQSLALIAKGALSATSKYAAYLQPFHVCEIDYHSQAPLSRFISASLIQRFEWVDVSDLAAATFITLSMDAINQREPQTFTLNDILIYYEMVKVNKIVALLKFCFELLKLDGRQLVLDACVNCGSLHISAFSLSAGGFCCRDCALHERIDSKAREVLKSYRCVAKAPLNMTLRCQVGGVTLHHVAIFVHELKETYPLHWKSWNFLNELV